MDSTSATSASRSRHVREPEDDDRPVSAPPRPVAREVDLDTLGSDLLHAASLAAFAGMSAVDKTLTNAPGAFTVGSMLPPWRQDVPVTSGAPVDVDKVEKNMLAHPDADAVLYIGMNTESAKKELEQLQKRAHVVTMTANSSTDDKEQKVVLGGRTYDLKPPMQNGVRSVDPRTGRPSESEFRAFLMTQGMPEAQAKRIADRMDALPNDAARVELAELASIFWRGQNGATIPSRFLISGHSGEGMQAWGDGAHAFSYDELRFLANEMPKAAAQIEDIHIGTCSSLNNLTLDLGQWQKSFPNLKTLWAYEHGAGHAPVADQVEWERQTRGHEGALTMSATMKQHHVAFWGASDNKVQGVGSYGEAKTQTDIADRHFAAMFSGEMRDPHAMEADYRAYRALSQRGDLDPKERKAVTGRADQLLRLRYYPDVAAKFAAAHAEEVARGCAALGARAPDFAHLDRAQARAEVKRLVDLAFVKDNAEGNKLATLLTAFDALDSTLLPDQWCQHGGRQR